VNGPEFLALMFGVVTFIGTLLNYNVIYAGLKNKRMWWLSRRFNAPFHWFHGKLRWGVYPITTLWLAIWAGLFLEKGLWVTAVFILTYFSTRMAAWFVLSPRTTFLKRHALFRCFGPSGRHEPITPPDPIRTTIVGLPQS